MLDAVQMLARAGTQRTLAEALAAPIRGFPSEAFTLPPGGGLAELLDQPSAIFTLQADLELGSPSGNGAGERVRYRVGVEIDPDTGALSLADEYLSRLRLSDARLSGSSYPLFDRVRDELRQWRTYYFDPASAMRAAAPPREVPDIGVKGEHLAPYLYALKVRSPNAFAAVGRALRSIIPAISQLDVDLDTKRGTVDIEIEQDGTVFSSRIVSEGTLRVLGLCAVAVTAQSGLIALEEPENGVQPQRLERIAELLASVSRRSGAQILVTTHSPGFVAAMHQCAQRDSADIGLFSVSRSGRSTVIKRLRDFGLWKDQAIDELLEEPDDYDKITALIRRGWLDL